MLVRFLLFVFLLWSFSAGGTLRAQEAQPPVSETDGLVDLTDEPSRGDLFQLVIAAAGPEAQNGIDLSTGIPFNLFGPFAFPNDAVFDVVGKKPRHDSIFGVDISHYTPSDIPLESFSLLKIRYVYCKATQGTGSKDGKFSAFWKRLGSLPSQRALHRGAYHFLTANGEGEAQAKTFLKVINESGGIQPTDMPPVVDLEWDIAKKNGPDRWVGTDPEAIIEKTLKWMEFVESKTNRRPILYTARAWWDERIHDEGKFAKFAKYKIWIADYSKSSRGIEVPKVPNQARAALWQFTDSARLSTGFGSGLDANIYKGSEDKFYKDFQTKKFN